MSTMLPSSMRYSVDHPARSVANRLRCCVSPICSVVMGLFVSFAFSISCSVPVLAPLPLIKVEPFRADHKLAHERALVRQRAHSGPQTCGSYPSPP
eukprot:5636756-Pyramimonas_sp.AAC.1